MGLGVQVGLKGTGEKQQNKSRLLEKRAAELEEEYRSEVEQRQKRAKSAEVGRCEQEGKGRVKTSTR